jgi:hypothetical protein
VISRAANSRRYFFVLRAGQRDDRPGCTFLPNDQAAKEYALRVIRELKEAGGFDEPELKMIVKNSSGKLIYLIPF